jgi:uncharacterized protein YdiU (UPF0061 family)
LCTTVLFYRHLRNPQASKRLPAWPQSLTMNTLACHGLTWTHRLSALGPEFFTRLQPTPLATPAWASRNWALLDALAWPRSCLDAPLLDAWSGNALLAGSDPLATVYSGHQFGVWAGQLGDGRALWLGEASSRLGPQEIQLKGAGRTPYSRMGDGRAVLRSSIREYLCSEAMHGLGIPTTRALCLVASPQPVQRETRETAAVVTRVAPSFLRFGHFEHFAASDQLGALRTLADHVIAQHLPESQAHRDSWQGNAYAALLHEVVQRTAGLIAQWQAVGFCHGVMNTDNMSLLGLTLDYGPFQFMDGFDPGHVCNHSDTHGRYAFARQPQMAYWNLYCLGQALLPLIGDQDLTVQVLDGYKTAFPQAMDAAMSAKLGLLAPEVTSGPHATDRPLIEDLLQLLATERVDYSIFWRRLSQAMARHPGDWADPDAPWLSVSELFLDRPGWSAWLARYRERLGPAPLAQLGSRMLRINPQYVLRNHLAEQAIRQAQDGDFSEVDRLLDLLQSPFEERPGMAAYADFPPDWAQHLEISCSS